MAATGTSARRAHPGSDRRSGGPAGIGLIAAGLLIAVVMVVPPATGWDVRIGLAPVFAHWSPRVGVGSLGAVLIGLLGIGYGHRLSACLSWRRLLAWSWIAS